MSVRFGLVFLALAAASIAVAEPSIQRIEPPGVGQGQETEIRITGAQLEEPRELFFEDSRISVAKLESDGSTAVKAVVRVPADCPLGGYRFRLRTADGLSDLRMFHVTKAAQTREQEPNNEPSQALAIDLAKLGSGGETIVWGTVGGEDVDTLKVHLPKGGRIDAVVDAVRLEQQPVDLYLELVDAEGFVVGDCDDHPLLCQDPALSVTVAEEGDYFLRVRETAFAGAAQPYQLHVGRFPVAHVAWPPGGRTGEAVDVEWVGDPAGPFRQKVTIPPAGLDGLARVHPVRDGVISPIAVPLRSTSVPVTVCAEPSGEPEQAGSAAAPAAIAGRMDSSDDVDWIRVTAAKGTKWKITGWARRLGTPVDLVIAAHRDNGKHDRITSNDDSNGPDSQIQVTVPDEGSFLLRVNDFQRLGGPEYVYWIDVEPLVAGATVSVPPAITRTQQRLVVGVPRGNRAALFLNASRVDCPDPLNLEFSGLPAGVTALTGPFTEPAPGGLVVFEAAADATPAVSLAEIKLTRGEGPQATVVGGLRQGTDTVIGEPNRTTWRTVYGDRMAVAVLDEAPVSIALDQPQVPIVRRGVMDLRVRVKRADGFTGKLRLELPFKPPGIGALNIDVKDGESEVVFPISASAEAAVREWPIAVAATVLPPGEDDKKRSAYRTVKGTWISTNPITLSVAEQIIDLVAEKAVAEQGSEFKMVFKLPEPAALEAPAKVTLMGLPVKVEATPVELSPKAETLEIPLKVGADAPAGKHDNIFCRIEVPLKGTIVVHQSAPTSIRIDKPLPGGVAAAAPSERSK